MYNTIAGLQQINNQQTADIRMFCDNDARWRKLRDLPTWVDDINLMSLDANKDHPACLDNVGTTTESTLAGTYTTAFKERGMPDQRSAITICDRSFVDPNNDARYLVIQAVVLNNARLLRGTNIQQLNYLSTTILHEVFDLECVQKVNVRC
jgi:hypothetical protein